MLKQMTKFQENPKLNSIIDLAVLLKTDINMITIPLTTLRSYNLNKKASEVKN